MKRELHGLVARFRDVGDCRIEDQNATESNAATCDAVQTPIRFELAQRQDRHNAHRHMIHRVHMAQGQPDHVCYGIERERHVASGHDDSACASTSHARRQDRIRNGRGASNSQGCCEPASAAMLLKQPIWPTSRKTPWRYSSPMMNPRMRGSSPQLQLLLDILLRQESVNHRS